MKRSILGVCLLLSLSLVGCGESENNSNLSNSENNSSGSTVQEDQYPLREQYVSINDLTFAKGVSMDEVVNYCDAHLEDDTWPRVRKYNYEELGYYDDEWFVMGEYGATYCYKYYDGRNFSNGNLFYMSELYILPELDKFVLNYNRYDYENLEIGNRVVAYTYQWNVTFNFDIDEAVSNTNFGGTYAFQGVKLPDAEIVALNSIAYLYQIDYMIPPCDLAYPVDSSYVYGIQDPSSAGNVTEDYLDEQATSLYNTLDGRFSFVDEFLKLVNSTYSLLNQ